LIVASASGGALLLCVQHTTARAGWRIAPSVGGPAGVAGFADEIGRSWLVDAADEPALHALQSLAYVYSREAANEKARELGWIV
jgi:hypothetical protein